jgi:hypothetical protein
LDQTQPFPVPPPSSTLVKSGVVTPIFDVGFMALLIWFISLGSHSTITAALLIANAAVLGGFGIWRFLYGFTVEVDQAGVSVSTRIWRLRGRPAIRLPWAVGIFATSCTSFWHRSVTINTLHLETPGKRQVERIRRALYERGVVVGQEPAGPANAIGISIFATAYVALFILRVNLIVWVVGYATILAFVVAHSVEQERQWRRVAAYLATLPPAVPTPAASQPG